MQARLKAKIAGFACMRSLIIWGCRFPDPVEKAPLAIRGARWSEERGRWRSKRSYAGSGRTPPTRPLGIRGRPRRHDPGASASSLRRSPTRRIRRHRPSRATKAKIEVDAWKKFLQTRVFGLTLHHAGPSRPSDCKRPALRDRATFRWGRHYSRADRVAGGERVGASRLSPGRLSTIRSQLRESYTNGLTLRATAIVKGFGCRPVVDPCSRAEGRRQKASEEGTRGGW